MDNVVRVLNQENKTVGYISTDLFGNKKVLDAKFQIRGYYNKADNLTLDIYNNIVGVGDGAYYLLKFI